VYEKCKSSIQGGYNFLPPENLQYVWLIRLVYIFIYKIRSYFITIFVGELILFDLLALYNILPFDEKE